MIVTAANLCPIITMFANLAVESDWYGLSCEKYYTELKKGIKYRMQLIDNTCNINLCNIENYYKKHINKAISLGYNNNNCTTLTVVTPD